MKITIINSKGHWQNGWLSTPKILKDIIASFQRSNIEVDIYEVSELRELESILKVMDADSLILPNAYYMDRFKGSKEFVWIGDIIEQYQLPFIGSGSQTLRNLLQKDHCQKILKENGILVPEFIAIDQSDMGKEREIIARGQLTYPAIVKPTSLSSSVGISQDSIVHNEKEAIAQTRMLLKTYETNVIIEDFLASDDITVSYLPGNSRRPKLHAAYYKVLRKSGVTSVIGREEAKLKWGERNLTTVNDRSLINQFKEIVPRVCKILNVKDITRVDGRLDANGQFRIFDVNAYPGLSMEISTQTALFEAFFPSLSKPAVYDVLINTILLSACHRYTISIPQIVQEHNLFTLEAPVSTIQNYENSIL